MALVLGAQPVSAAPEPESDGAPAPVDAPPPPPPPIEPPPATAATAPRVAPEVTPAPLTGASRLDANGLVEAEQQAYGLYMDGVHALDDAADPDLAIDKWEQALRTLPDERPYALSRGALALRLVTAHQVRFFRDGDLDDLRREKSLLLGYQERLVDMVPTDAEARSSRHSTMQTRIDEIDGELSRLEDDQGTTEEQLGKSLRGEYAARGAETWRPDPSDMGWHPRADDPRKHASQAHDGEVAPEETTPEIVEPTDPGPRPGTGRLVVGAVLTGAGLGGLGVGAVGLVQANRANTFDPEQDPQQRRMQIGEGERANGLALGGLIGGGVLTVVGLAVLISGARKRSKSPSRAALTPAVTPTHLGASLRATF